MILVLIGIDGAGKTTVARALAARLAPAQGVLVLGNYSGRKTFTAWAGRLGWRVPARAMDAAETLVRLVNVLVNSARAARFDGTVIMDRHLHCQLALRSARGLGRGVLVPAVMRLLPRPEAVVLLDLPAEQAYARIAARGTDSETLGELQAYRKAYLELAEEESLTVVNAAGPTGVVLEEFQDFLAGISTTGPRGTAPRQGCGGAGRRLVR